MEWEENRCKINQSEGGFSNVFCETTKFSLDLKDKGFLTFEDFKKAFNSVSAKLSERIIAEASREVDQDSDGCISFKEFESAVKYGQDEVSPVYFAYSIFSGGKTK